MSIGLGGGSGTAGERPDRRRRGQDRSRDRGASPVSLPINPAPGLARMRQTLAARRREIRHRMLRPPTCTGQPKVQFTVNQHTVFLNEGVTFDPSIL